MGGMDTGSRSLTADESKSEKNRKMIIIKELIKLQMLFQTNKQNMKMKLFFKKELKKLKINLLKLKTIQI
jgi:hypothetical protein